MMSHELRPDIEADSDDDPLVQAATAESEFAAQTKAAVLEDEGIEAFVFPAERAWTGGLAIAPSGGGVPVWVRRSELQRAQQALTQRIADSVDLDWNEVDVGEPEDSNALTPIVPSSVLKIIVAVGAIVAAALILLTVFFFGVDWLPG